MRERFYQLMKQSEKQAELYIYGDITSIKSYENDVCAYDLAKELNELDGIDIVVRINSYGGDVGTGLAIHSLLKEYKGHVTTVCDPFACSIASTIYMAGDTRIMYKTSLLMIHHAWTVVAGNAEELRKTADDLTKVTQPSVEIYKSVSNLTEEEISRKMDSETWINANDALSWGFATEIREQGAKQSLQDCYLQRMIEKNSKLEKQLNDYREQDQRETKNEWSLYFGIK